MAMSAWPAFFVAVARAKAVAPPMLTAAPVSETLRRNSRREDGSLFARLIFDPGNLRDELVERGESDVCARGKLWCDMRREGCERGIAHEEDVEVLRKILVTGTGPR